ncbi:hypothetical protein N865_07290 [Intrasporangium oryzae NRRL B-24470]|uniref:ANTAR domain-containing protein n=1 Tax=Intrasporangium oryzae NRRL B-24470 TaxID=1386089 RepID=W9GE25_9MICO|nr:ANTAR domain-containing protein [Intrasporangium oryzae]EWT02109.1 hypothetical protein N865_07290 [Intrasporangium oryzae NRRL B-24470]
MKPIAQTDEALRQLSRYGDDRLATDLAEVVRRAVEKVPDLVGFSLGLVQEGIVLTYVLTAGELSALDGVQDLGGGPGVDAAASVDADAAASVDDADDAGLLDEGRWLTLAQSGSALGVLSTLSLPLLEHGAVTVGISLYGAGSDTFVGREEELARLFGAWPPGATSNADLSFSTRLEAARAPSRLEDLATIDLAVRVLCAAHGVSPSLARAHLEEAAADAGVDLVALAIAVVHHGKG